MQPYNSEEKVRRISAFVNFGCHGVIKKDDIVLKFGYHGAIESDSTSASVLRKVKQIRKNKGKTEINEKKKKKNQETET